MSDFEPGQKIAEQAVARARDQVGTNHEDPERAALELARDNILAEYGPVSREAAGVLYLLADHLDGDPEGLSVWYELLDVEQQVFGPIPHEETLGTVNNLANACGDVDMLTEAEIIQRCLIEIDPTPSSNLWNLARTFDQHHENMNATRLLEQLLHEQEDTQKYKGMAAYHLACCYEKYGRDAEIRPLYEEGLRLLAPSDNQYEHSVAVHNYGHYLRYQDELEAAEPYMRRALEMKAENSSTGKGIKHSYGVMASFVKAYVRRGETEKAQQVLEYLNEFERRSPREDSEFILGLELASLELELSQGNQTAARETMNLALQKAAAIDSSTYFKVVDRADQSLRYWGQRTLAEWLFEQGLEQAREFALDDENRIEESLLPLLNAWTFPQLKVELRTLSVQANANIENRFALVQNLIEAQRLDEAAHVLGTIVPEEGVEEEEDREEEDEQEVAEYRAWLTDFYHQQIEDWQYHLSAQRGDPLQIDAFLQHLEARVTEMRGDSALGIGPSEEEPCDLNAEYDPQSPFMQALAPYLKTAAAVLEKSRSQVADEFENLERLAFEQALDTIIQEFGEASREQAALLFLRADSLSGTLESLSLMFELLRIEREAFGPLTHDITHATLTDIAMSLEALDLQFEGITLLIWAIRLKPSSTIDIYNLGRIHNENRQHQEAIVMFEEVLARGDDVPNDIRGESYHSLATSYRDKFRISEARHAFERGIEILSQSQDYRQYLNAMHSYACFLRRRKELAAAEALLRSVIEGELERFGPSSELEISLRETVRLAIDACKQGDLEQAERLLEHVNAAYDCKFEFPPKRTELLLGRCALQLSRGEQSAARVSLQAAIALAAEDPNGEESPAKFGTLYGYAEDILRYWGARELAELLCEEGIHHLSSISPNLRASLVHSISNYSRHWGFKDLAVRLGELYLESFGDDSSRVELARALIETKRIEEAEALLAEIDCEALYSGDLEQIRVLRARIGMARDPLRQLLASLAELRERIDRDPAEDEA